jgi:hypothetical protein
MGEGKEGEGMRTEVDQFLGLVHVTHGHYEDSAGTMSTAPLPLTQLLLCVELKRESRVTFLTARPRSSPEEN